MSIVFSIDSKGRKWYCLEEGNNVHYDLVNPEIIAQYKDEYDKFLELSKEKLMKLIDDKLKHFDDKCCCDFH
ncbi:hypothetical protein WKH57_01365 [Niallia taxi]|uniref:hypothetical protein n=1 Tax=Niallia taxi TaxID=2499688 RepID=UPI003175C103